MLDEPEQDDRVNSWDDMMRWKPDFPEVIHRWLETIARLVLKTAPHGDDSLGHLIIGCLGASLPDINDIMTLSHFNSHYGAGKILRGFFERVVSIKYLAQNQSEIQRFVDFDAIDTEEVIKAIEKTHGFQMGEEGRSNLAKAATEARERYKQEKCAQCKKPRYMGWTGMNTKDMAERVGLAHLHLHAFLLTSKVLHTTYWGMHEVAQRNSSIVNNLNTMHELIIHALILHRRHFFRWPDGSRLAADRVTPMLNTAINEFLRTWVYSTVSFDGILTRGRADESGRQIYY